MGATSPSRSQRQRHKAYVNGSAVDGTTDRDRWRVADDVHRRRAGRRRRALRDASTRPTLDQHGPRNEPRARSSADQRPIGPRVSDAGRTSQPYLRMLSATMRTSDELLAELKALHPRLHRPVARPHRARCWPSSATRSTACRPSSTSPAPTARARLTAFLKAMLQAAGKRVHVYTSPHLVRFHERIELAGADGKAHANRREPSWSSCWSAPQRANAGDAITFFEITTAAAFLAFAEHPADALILEVGLGGRLDATNVVARPALSVITPVSMDHADKLGDTRRARSPARRPASSSPACRRCVVAPAGGGAGRHPSAGAARSGRRSSLWGERLRGLRAARPPRRTRAPSG